MNALFGDATTAMPTPATQAERGSLIGSPGSIDIRGGGPQPFGAQDAIPGLDIDPPDLEVGADGKAIMSESFRGRSGEGVGGWIGRMVSRTRGERSESTKGRYGRIDQDD